MGAAATAPSRPRRSTAVPADSHCNGQKRQGGGLCRKPAGWGTPHVGFDRCKLHGGNTPTGIRHAAKLQAAALAAADDAALDRLRASGRTLELVVDPFDAVLRMLYKAAGWEQFCTSKVAELEDTALVVETMRVAQTTGGDGQTRIERTNERALHIWIVEQQRARTEVARLAKVAIDAGVAERYVRVAEHTAEAVARAMDHLISELGLNATQMRRAPAAVRRSLQLVEAPPVAA